MSKTVDERVVSMEFDNKNFEKNVQTSMSTLEKLKNSLNFKDSEKSLESLSKTANKVDMGGLSNAVETVHVKFKALEVIGITALQNITNSAIETGERLVKSLSLDQISAGFKKYNDEVSSVQSLVNSTGKSVSEIETYLSKLMWYSDETSYGFTDMTSALATMVSSGGDINKLIPMIEGVANATAFAGKGASEFSRIMQYSINQAYSLGYMQVQDWKTIEGATVNSKQLIQSLIKAGEELHTIEEGQVTIENFRNTLADKWVTKEVMEQGFGEFANVTEKIYEGIQNGTFETYAEGLEKIGTTYGDVAYRAAASAQEAKTFREAIDATKDAVSSAWNQTFKLIFGNYDKAKQLWTDVSGELYEIFAEPLQFKNTILSDALTSNWEKLIAVINESDISAETFKETLIDVAKESGVLTDDMIKDAGSFEATLRSGWLTMDIYNKTMDKLGVATTGFSGVTTEATGRLEELQKIVQSVINGDLDNGYESITKLTEAGYDHAEVQNLVNLLWEKNGKTWANTTISAEDLQKAIDEISDEELKNIGYTKEQIDTVRELGATFIDGMDKISGREHIVNTLINTLQSIKIVLSTLRDSFNEAFGPTAEQIYNFTEALDNLSTKVLTYLTEHIDDLKNTFDGLFAVIDIIVTIAKGALYPVFKLLGTVFGETDFDILHMTGSFGELIVKFRDWLKQIPSTEWFNNLKETIVNAFNSVKDTATKFIGEIIDKPAVQKALSKIEELLIKIDLKTGGLLTNISETIKGTFGSGSIRDSVDKLGTSVNSVGSMFEKCDLKVSGLKDTVNSFGNIFKDGKISELISSFGANISDTFDFSGIKLDNFIDKLTKFKDGIVKVFEFLKNKLSNVGIGELLTIGLGVGVVKSLSKVSGLLGVLAGGLKGVFDFAVQIKEVFSSVKGVLDGFKKSLKADAFKKNAEGIKIIAESIVLLAGAITVLCLLDQGKLWGSIGAIAALSAVLVGLSKAMNIVDPTKTGIKSALSIIELSTALLLVANAMKKISQLDPAGVVLAIGVITLVFAEFVGLMAATNLVSGKASIACLSILEMAEALLVVANALNKISKIEPEGLVLAIGTMTVVFTEFVGLMAATNLVSGTASIACLSILEMAEALLVVAKALNKISKIEPEGLVLAIGTMTVVFTEFVGLMAATNLISGTASIACLSILEMAEALLVVSKALNKISKIEPEGLVLAIGTMTVVFTEFVGLMAATNLIVGKASIACLSILEMAGALLIISEALKIMASINVSDLVKSMVAMEVLMIQIRSLMVTTSLIPNAGGNAGNILAVAAALLILSASVARLSDLDEKGLARATGSMAVLEAMLAVLMVASKAATGSKSTIIGLAVALGVMAVAVGVLSKIEEDKLKSASNALSLLIGMLSILVASTSFASKEAIDVVITMTAVVAALGALLYLLASMDNPEACVPIAAGISLLLAALSVSMVLLSDSSEIGKVEAGTIGKLAILAAIAAGLGLLITALADNCSNVDAVLPIVAGISLLLTVLSANMLILSRESIANVDFTTVGQLAILAAIASALGVVIVALADNCQNADAVIPIVEAISILLTVLSGNLLLLAVVGKMGPAAIGGIVSLAAFIAAMLGLMTGIGSIASHNPEFEEFVNKSLPLLEAAGQGIGRFIGGIGEGIMDAIGNGLANLGQRLGDFMINSEPFFSGLKDVKASQVKAVGMIADMILALSEAKLLEGISRLFGSGSFESLGEQLAAFGDSVTGENGFLTKINSIPDGAETKTKIVVEALKDFVELANDIPSSGGWLQKITGNKDLANFGSEMTSFARNFTSYALSVKGLPDETNDKSKIVVEALKDFVALSNEMPSSGGWLQKITGEKDLANFGSEMTTFARNFLSYALSVKGLPDETNDKSKIVVEALKDFVGLANDMPATGGWVQKIIGEKDLANFGSEMSTFARNFTSYALSVKGLPDETSDKTRIVTEALKEFLNLSNEMPSSGGWVQKIIGEKDLANFGSEMTSFARNFLSYALSVKGLPDDTSDKSKIVVDVLKDFVGLSSEIGGNTNWWEKLWGQDNALSSFGSDLIAFGSSMKAYYDEISGISAYRLSMAISQTNELVSMAKGMTDFDTSCMSSFGTNLTKLGESGVDGFISAFEKANSKITTAVSDMIDTFTNAVNSKFKTVQTSFKNLATEALNSLNSVLSNFKDSGVTAATNFGDAAVTNIRNYYWSFYNAGEYLVEGLADGIYDYTYKARNAAAYMSQQAYYASRSYLNINSPSKLFRSMAKCIPEGMAQGIERNTWMVENASTSMAQASVNRTSSILSRIVDAVNSDIDTQPSIRPVLDLSDVTNGAKRINGMLNNNRTLSLANGVSGYNYGSPGNVTINMTVNGAQGQDVNQLAEIVSERINNSITRRANAWA